MTNTTTNTLLLEGVHPSAIDYFKNHNFGNITTLPKSLTEDELIDMLQDIHYLGIRSRTQITAKVLQNTPHLLGIGCFCIGTNQVDLAAATANGIAVFNAPFSNTRSVAELVLAESILLLRGIAEKNALAHRGVWLKSAKDSFEIRGKKLGLVGYGNIGSQLSVMAEALGIEVLFYDVNTKLALGNAVQVPSLEKLLQTCDIISLHVPEDESTKNMIGNNEIKLMKPGSVLINASRGTVVDINALVENLKNGHLKGAAIDVFPAEPKSNDEVFNSPLTEFDNVIITPHIGGSTMEAQENIGEEVAKKMLKFHRNGSTVSSVNFPEVALPAHPNKHRLLHVHTNVPGVLSEINDIFSENKINISAQYLQTNTTIGYVVTDIDAEYSELALNKIKQVKGTIKTRVLF